jgi:hypothetical protein
VLGSADTRARRLSDRAGAIARRTRRVIGRRAVHQAKKMRFSRITQFDPVLHQPVLRDWFGKG